MRSLTLASLLVLLVAACSSSPEKPCAPMRIDGAGGGDPTPAPSGVVGQPVSVVFQLQLPLDCQGMTQQATRVDVTVLDPMNHQVNATASAPRMAFAEADSTVTFTPATAGDYHVTVRFDPNLGTVQKDVLVTP